MCLVSKTLPPNFLGMILKNVTRTAEIFFYILINLIFNTLQLFWLILGLRKTSLVIILWKNENEFSCLFGHNIIFNDLYKAIRNNIVAKKTNELVLFFHKNKTKLVFLWSNMSQKSCKVLLIKIIHILFIFMINFL